MPEIDGFQLAEQIQQQGLLAGGAMIMLSSAGNLADVERCQKLGIVRCLIKPVKQSDLRNAILRALGSGSDDLLAVSDRLAHAAPGKTLRILLVEDGLVNQQVASRLLKVRGHQVVIASNGREALRTLQDSSFDIVLMDVQMPEMDGYETTAAIRLEESRTGGHVPIIAMTAHAMMGDRERCLEAGMDDYLTKPIHAKALFETVEGFTRQVGLIEPPEAENLNTEGAIDWDTAVSRLGGRTELLQQMANLFFKECEQSLATIRDAIAAQDAVRLHRVAHLLKGTLDCFAAQEAVEAALQLERIGQQADLTEADRAFVELGSHIERVKRALRAHAN
jgi:CheY-like chemotaxis protein